VEWADKPEFATNPARLAHREVLVPLVAEALRKLPAAQIIAGLEAVKVPVGPVHTLDQALNSDQAVARDMTVDLASEHADRISTLGNPLNLSRTPVQYTRPPPVFGQDTDAVLDWLKSDK
jgi:crotonobetainyl-CoA:carnitine CoA-transferase CaiB-like acyl-CoA transferase